MKWYHAFWACCMAYSAWITYRDWRRGQREDRRITLWLQRFRSRHPF